MRPENRQVVILGRAHTKSRAEHVGVCAELEESISERDLVEDCWVPRSGLAIVPNHGSRRSQSLPAPRNASPAPRDARAAAGREGAPCDAKAAANFMRSSLTVARRRFLQSLTV